MIVLIQNKQVQIDEEDAYLLSLYPWSLDLDDYVVYSFRHKRKTVTIKLHQLIVNSNRYIDDVDHINRDKLDNRRANLRICTRAENCFNRAKLNCKPTTSKYKGVCWDKDNKNYRAYIKYNYRLYHLMCHTDPLVCAYAYNVAAEFFVKEFAYLNPVEELDSKIKDEVKAIVLKKLCSLPMKHGQHLQQALLHQQIQQNIVQQQLKD